LLLFRFIRRFISFILLLLIAIPLYVVGSVWYTARNTEPVKSDFILVMGAAQFDGRPSDILKSRLEHALDIYKAGYAPKIYTVGAGAPGDRTTEAAASKAWLIDRGVKKNNVIAVAKGRDTLGSTKAYVEAADKAKLKSVIIVTDPYHCLRSKKMAQDLGLLASCTAVESGPASVANSEFKYLARESGAYLAYITLGRFGINLSDR
jgi:uncharacterized SAM-binding protein YcdF (DUF218 family)